MKPTEIKSLRREHGLTQTEFAALLRMSDRRTVRRWEEGAIAVSGPVSILLEMLAAGELPPRFLAAVRAEAS
jgi:DNA-binding transcriptional regulator YiaG